MLRITLCVALMVMFTGEVTFAQEGCEIKAISKDGKPLAGAAKSAFVKKCKADTCESKAIGKYGKPLAGAAKSSFMEKCEKDA